MTYDFSASGGGPDGGPPLLRGPGEVRALMRACDWAATPIGPPPNWPASLRTTVRMMLSSRFAMWMAWGPELTFLCNDAYLPTVGLKRDWVIGARSDSVWAEIWADIGPRIDRVLATGEATWDEALLLYLERKGFTEETYHTFSYSPLVEDDGAVAGMLCVVAEVTERVIGERQLAALRDLGATLAAASTRAEVMSGFEACLAAYTRDVPFAFVYLTSADGVPRLTAAHDPVNWIAWEAGGEASDAGRIWPLLEAAHGASIAVDLDGLGIRLRDNGSAETAVSLQPVPQRALVQPIASSEQGAPVGYLVVGLNPNRFFDATYKGFVDLLTAQVAAAIARADEYERARERADALTELDRAKTAFFSNVSHEFRTPLTLMLGPLEDALADGGVAHGQRDLIDIAHRNALRLLRLVNSLLDFSRIEAGRVSVTYRRTDLAALTAELASSFRAATDKAGLVLTVDTPKLSQAAFVDHDMWEKIVLNLLSNAFKFTFEGEICVVLREIDGAARLTVRDTGTGIPASQIEKLFDRFHRVEGARGRSFEGSGIGLALVRELVKLHEGDIEVESQEGVGTAFHVTIPLGTAVLADKQAEEADGAAAPALRPQSFVEEALRWLPDGAGGALLDTDVPVDGTAVGGDVRSAQSAPCRVLVADDNADLRGYVGRLLKDHGYEVDATADGEAALAAIRARRPDLLITDVMMPRLDGFGLLQEVRRDAALRDMPVIMLSARAGEEAKVEGLNAGADDYLTKPFSARELLARVAANIALARLRREAAAAVSASEAKAREQAERVQLALDAGAIIGTWVWDVQADHVVGDERFARSFGLDPTLCQVGLSLADVMVSIHEDDRETVSDAIAASVRNGGPYRCEFRVRQQDGVFRWIEANGRVDMGKDGTAMRFPGVLIDIDHRRAIEAELRALNDELEQRVQGAIEQRERAEEALRQSQKMEAVGQLTGGIAHDFNNLLAGISASLQMLETRVSQGRLDALPRYLDAAQGAAKRAAALTQRLLAFSRRQTLDPKPTNINRLIGGMEDLIRRTVGPGIVVEVVGSAGLWPILIDQNQLENALLNLCINARDAMPDGGRLTIETANKWLDETAGKERDLSPGQYVSLCVTDSGTGMSRETMARIFDPFFTTKPIGQGTGLGLSMIYGFARQSNGQVRAYSELGHGTTMCLYFPRHHGDVADSVVRDKAMDGVENGFGETVLVVDDEPTVRMLVADLLQDAGYRVMEAADGPEGLKILQTDVRVDLLITDVGLPGGMNGRQVADAGRIMRPGLQVLFITGYAENAAVGNGHLEPGMQVMTKPFSIEALAKKVREMIDASAQAGGGFA
jgi:signal transduction histidine kinase/DNA-binding response OmpR family regulator